jgi:hypothetical protein
MKKKIKMIMRNRMKIIKKVMNEIKLYNELKKKLIN